MGIHKPAFRKKILRHINARLLGVGTVPDSLKPSEVNYSLESCSTVSFSWIKPDARGFPVHSYKVQRRDIDLYSSSDTHSNYNSNNNDLNIFPELKSPWVNIYCGGEPQFHDNTLKLGNSFIYRIQAWNSVGRSEWVDIDITPSLKKKKCTDPPIKRRIKNSRSRGMYGMQHDSISGSFAFAESVITFIAIIATLMKISRAYAPSSMNPSRTWLIKILGIPISKESEHDNYVKAVGLNGYKASLSNEIFSELDTPSKRRKKLKKAVSDMSLSNQSMDESTQQTRGVLENTPSEKTLPCNPNIENTGDICVEIPEKKAIRKRLNFKQLLLRFDQNNDGVADHNRKEQKNSNMSTSLLSEAFDDYTKCNTCHKKYKVGKRWRHHCARCLATFCHKHGKITHSNFTSCKVPGTCICDVCLSE